MLWQAEWPPPLWYDDAEMVALMVGVRWRYFYIIRSLLHVPNRADDPAERFSVYRSDVDDLASIVGVAHSHCQEVPEPSRADLRGIPPKWLGMVVAGEDQRWYVRGKELGVRLSIETTRPPSW